MFFYYEKNTDRFILTTNIRAVSEFSGLPYNKVRSWFLDGLKIHKDDNILCIETDVVRGKQRLSFVEKKEKELGEEMVKGQVDTILSGSRSDLPKRQTKQPNSRDMKGYDDFFKEVQ
jgi:hypothetical protein